jgi:glycosyltransferase involved in cell wall biosynthesis
VADHFVSPSEFLMTRFVEWGLDPAKCSVIENGLDIHEPTPPRASPAGRRNRFAYFGQITLFKGVDVLLDAVTRIPEAVWGDDSQLMIFGGNLERQPKPFQEKIEALVERAGNRVRFYGAYQNTEMPRLMRNIDWTIIPSIWWENSPIVIQEAFFHGRPMIASNIGGMAEKVTDGVDGLHFRAGSSEDIRRPIDIEECARRHVAVYDRIAAGRPARSSPHPVARTA